MSGVSASEARGIAARVKSLRLAGTFRDRTEGARAWLSRVEQAYVGETRERRIQHSGQQGEEEEEEEKKAARQGRRT